jgi:hypothetical protein
MAPGVSGRTTGIADHSRPERRWVARSGQRNFFEAYVRTLCDGQSLRQQLLKKGELPVADVARILREVADAI